jgi:hypothetical protein
MLFSNIRAVLGQLAKQWEEDAVFLSKQKIASSSS